MEHICQKFKITDNEYRDLDKAFGSLCEYASWQLIKNNSKNNHTDEQADIAQELRMSLVLAGCYYKRQLYIEKSLELCNDHIEDEFLKMLVIELRDLWKNKKRHGANRQKFGPYQEKVLERLLKTNVPKSELPSKKLPLKIDAKFTTYCKAIAWNKQKTMGKKITKEKGVRGNQVSLSEFDYLVTA